MLLIFLLPAATYAETRSHQELVEIFSGFGDRHPGTEGNLQAASFVTNYLTGLGFSPQSQVFSMPVRQVDFAHLKKDGATHPLQPFLYNAITPQTTEKPLNGPLYYAGDGSMENLKGIPIKNSIVALDLNSGISWQTIAELGALAAIMVDDGSTRSKHFFKEKQELSPIHFPMYWMQKSEIEKLFGPISITERMLADSITIEAAITWREVTTENIYSFIPGSNPELSEELLVVEAFYDNDYFLPGNAPAADQATSIITLLKTAEKMRLDPPGRSVLLLATSGHAQALAGMREVVWTMKSQSREMRSIRQQLRDDIKRSQENLDALKAISFPLSEAELNHDTITEAIKNTLKAAIDEVSRQLVSLRLRQEESQNREMIENLVEKRFNLRQLSWKTSFTSLTPQETVLFRGLLPQSIAEHGEIIRQRREHLAAFESTRKFRTALREYDIAAIISLHLSTHGSGVGGFHEGGLYELRPRINRTGIYSAMGDVLSASAANIDTKTAYVDSLRPSRLRTWDTYFLGKPHHGGEVSSLAGFLGITLATTGDGRHTWGTPWDTMAEVDLERLIDQERLVNHLLMDLSRADTLSTGKTPRNGFSTVVGQANLLLQGELFADYPARKSLLMSFQGESRYYTTVDPSGFFMIKGIADSKNVQDKIIIEGYRFDEETGRAQWAIDKKETGKKNYRIKVQRKNMKTDLIFFSGIGTTIFGNLEPRNFMYMTKIDLLDGRRDAPPAHYWYSRIDTRSSVISTIYTEPNTWLKLTLSETVLTRKFILTNSTPEKPLGNGYPVEIYNTIHNTSYHAARDMWGLLQPRINNLERHGIVDPRINALTKQGLTALDRSTAALEAMDYLTFKESALEALSIAGKVYVQVEDTQKDVLFGVLFYIALFVPFAFCLERFLFNYANIYKRISAFTLLLLGLITIIYNVHPAFQLAYSPTVVILAFFIIGLSMLVSLIIFFRFEEEMILLQRHSSHQRPSEISRWKAFVAAFFLGVSNLRKRRLRTVLTCLTLIILTFTIMSFTTVKSSTEANAMLYEDEAPYQGLLLKTINWQGLPRQAEIPLTADLNDQRTTVSRIWYEGLSRTRPLQVPLYANGQGALLKGLVGMDPAEPQVTGIDRILNSGRWFANDDLHTVILEERIADQLGVRLDEEQGRFIKLWGKRFEVVGIFSATALEAIKDLDGEPLTPVIFPQEAATWMTAAEQEAMAAQDEVRTMQSRYAHLDAGEIAFIPGDTLLAMGGELQSVAIKPGPDEDIDSIGRHLVQRFNLPVFAGNIDGVWFFSPTSTLSYSGVPNILIPLIISIFIVLNTMISSVYERRNEIAVYTSVGLAPTHVAFLFIAEAMALAVISVVLGYLLAQVSTALFAATSFWAGITVNYSSLAGVAAMILVIIVVLISVIYPSRVAAQIAIPDVKRSFKLPAPVDNRIVVTLPFFMKFEEHESIGGYIHSYLAGHRDISHGTFSTGPVNIIFSCTTVDEIKQMVVDAEEPSALNCMHIRTNVWLAPFDFGIMQKVDIQFCPARDNSNYLEIKITLQRYSGELAMWKRINKVFIHDIRKQLLIWRALDDAGHHHYAKLLREVIAEEEKEAILPDLIGQQV